MPGNSRDNRRVRASPFAAGVLLALTGSLIASPAEAGDAVAGRAKAVQCQACHGANGIATLPEAPNLAGQSEVYLVKALGEYRSGTRRDEMMSVIAKPLSDTDIANLAAYFHGIEFTVAKP